jgi:hypothetical protein
MTTKAWSFGIDHQNDAGFRAWVADFITALTDVGMVQTADTGQINTGTATRPGTNTDGGYAIFYLNDSLHGTAPIYLKFHFGTGSASASHPRIRVLMGTATNGAGTLSGVGHTIMTASYGGGSGATGTSRLSWMCATEGFFGYAWGTGGGGTGVAMAGYLLCRKHDALGAPTAEAVSVLATIATSAGIAPAIAQARFAATAASYAVHVTACTCAIPASVTSTLVGADTQAFPFWGWSPELYPNVGWAAVMTSENAEGTTFDFALLDGVSRTYLNIGRQLGTPWVAVNTALYGLGMIWE